MLEINFTNINKHLLLQGKFNIINVSEDVMEVLEITGFASLLSVSKK